ncbi:mucin-21-like [Mercenaria mercenaria]|uniref:mucin-21-like n=1 Tax=Mercenaria mercenaria TaxID=6596 RepID=UPI00234F35EE|nr:mucin-21-like [Mercenaria mercenaria]
MYLQTGILFLYLVSAHALLRLKPLNGHVEHVQLDQVRTDHDIVERSVEEGCQFPYLLRFRFEVNGTEINFYLQKNDKLNTNVPLYVMKNGQLEKKETPETNNFALYQDPNRGSAMLVSCDEDGSFELHGSFYHNGDMYHMSPSNVPELSQSHFIQRNAPSENRYLHDAVMPPPDVTSENRKSAEPTRGKRQTSTGNVVELLIAADVSIYNYFLSDQGDADAAEAAVQQYMALLVNEMELHYMSVAMADSSLDIRLYLSGVIIAETAGDASWSTSSQRVTTGIINGEAVTKAYIDVSVILNNIRAWRRTQSNFPQHDHMMAMSMVDVANFSSFPVSTGVEGVAYVGTVCNSNYQVSFTEVDGSRVSGVAAHELGHALGSEHDGQSGTTSSSCSPSAKNIMTSVSSATTTLSYAEAQWTFSQCSVAAFKSFINGLSSNCMQEHAFSNGDFALAQQQQLQQLPGIVYSLDQQCQMYSSTSSCQSSISDSDCYGGYHCATDTGCSGTYYPLYPLAGTPCGSSSENKWCYRGLCVARTVIATTTTTTDSTTSSTTSTISSTTSSTSTSSTTSTTPSTTSSTSTTTSTTSSTPSTTTSSTPSTTSTTSTSSSTSTTTTSTTSSTSSTPTTTTTACTSDEKCCKTFWIGWRWKRYCCRGENCCQNSWARDTTCFNNCCSNTTPVSTVSPYCTRKCCLIIGWGRNRRRVCCTGNDCCQEHWGAVSSCCRYCRDNNGNENNTTTTPATTTTTTAACYRGKCYGTIRRGRKIKLVSCKGNKCCSYSWAKNSICCRTCKSKSRDSSESR